MDKKAFEAAIESHNKLAFYQPARNGLYFVKNWRGDVFEIAGGEVERVPYKQLEMIFLKQREPKVMEHMTRVCGYYSDVKNWNASKVAELKDRRLGDYEVHS
jgi:hypothetical protein